MQTPDPPEPRYEVWTGDVTSGQVVVGSGNTVIHHGTPAEAPTALDSVRAELVSALTEVRRELVRLRDVEPGAVPEEDATDAVRALDEAEAEAARPQPNRGVLRRRVHAITDALGEAAALSAVVVALQSAFDALVSVG